MKYCRGRAQAIASLADYGQMPAQGIGLAEALDVKTRSSSKLTGVPAEHIICSAAHLRNQVSQADTAVSIECLLAGWTGAISSLG